MYVDHYLQVIDVKTNKIIVHTGPKFLIVHSMHQISNIKINKTKRLFSFKMTPYTYYIELTNEKAGKKTTTKEFIENSHLTWFSKSLFNEV